MRWDIGSSSVSAGHESLSAGGNAFRMDLNPQCPTAVLNGKGENSMV